MEWVAETQPNTIMMLDAQLVLSDAQAVTTTANSTNVFDIGENKGVLGAGESIEFGVIVTEAFAGLTDLTIQVVGSDAENLSSPEIIDGSSAILLASLTAGKRVFAGKVNLSGKHRYYGIKYVVNGTATGGKVTSYFNLDQYEHNTYPSGFEVLTN